MKRPMNLGEVRKCVGGWKVCVNADSQAMSGPWATESAAVAASKGEWDEAHRLERALRRGAGRGEGEG